jgi:DNA-binding FadR family transcriptional regulator
VEVHGATRSAKGSPGRERSRRRGDGQIGLPLPSARDLAERLLVDRRDVRERARARNTLAADEVIGRDLDAGHGDAVAHRTSSKTCAPASMII